MPPPPPPPVLGGGVHSPAKKGLGESQFRRGDINCTVYTLLFIRTLWLQVTAIPTAGMAATAVRPAGALAADSAAGPAAKCAVDPPGAVPGVGGEAGAGLIKPPSPKTLPSSQSPTSYFPILLCSLLLSRTLYIYCEIGYPKLFLFLHLGNKWF